MLFNVKKNKRRPYFKYTPRILNIYCTIFYLSEGGDNKYIKSLIYSNILDRGYNSGPIFFNNINVYMLKYLFITKINHTQRISIYILCCALHIIYWSNLWKKCSLNGSKIFKTRILTKDGFKWIFYINASYNPHKCWDFCTFIIKLGHLFVHKLEIFMYVRFLNGPQSVIK